MVKSLFLFISFSIGYGAFGAYRDKFTFISFTLFSFEITSRFTAGPSFSRSAYRNVFNVCSEEALPGLTQAIMIVLLYFLLIKESRNTSVSFDPLKGTCD